MSGENIIWAMFFGGFGIYSNVVCITGEISTWCNVSVNVICVLMYTIMTMYTDRLYNLMKI